MSQASSSAIKDKDKGNLFNVKYIGIIQSFEQETHVKKARQYKQNDTWIIHKKYPDCYN